MASSFPHRVLLPAALCALALAGCGTTAVRPPAETVSPALPERPAAAPAPVPRRGGAYYKDDGPGDNPPPDLDAVPDAVPRLEPLHRFANRPYNVFGTDYVPASALAPFRQRGTASWYGRRFHGKPTSSGERYDMYAMTGAHPTLPIPSYARVTNLRNGRTVVVRVNDRGPFHKGRVMDLSYAAAHRLGYANGGSAEVEVEAVLPEGVEVIATNAAPVPPMRGRAAGSVALDTPEPVRAAVDPAEAGSLRALRDATPGVFLQLGVFSSAANAEGFRALVRDSFAEFADRLEVLADGSRYRLHLGPFDTAGVARAEAERIAAVLKLRPFVVQR